MKSHKPEKAIMHLTAREKECLHWAAKGKSSEETALILNIRKTTVNYYRKQIKEKLSCINMTQAVYEAFKQGQFF